VLTLENPRGQFDAVVFGELAKGKWMAGSDSHRRTHRQQNGWPAESADPKTTVQIAIAYKGKQVSIYRNGEPYASYTMAKPPPAVFSDRSVVVMGLRHVAAEQKSGPIFLGSIDDARIYNTALTAKQIASLKPNKLAGPKPLAWWSFEDGKAEDQMKTFPAGRLVGKARIAGGKLHLSGGHLLVAAAKKPVRTGPEKVIFHDGFDAKPAGGWTWLRENAKTWRVRESALEIHVEPGVAHNVRNALLRPAPDCTSGTFAFEVTVTNATRPTRQYEQAGITWYRGGRPVFKLVKELIGGKLYIIPGKKPMSSKTVQLRLVVAGNNWTAQYRPDGKGEFLTAAKGKLRGAGKDQVSIQCYNGPPDAEHWIRFDDFRILRLGD